MSQPTRVNNNVFGVENCKSQPRDWTQFSCVEGRFFHHWATREAHYEEPHVSPQCCKDAVLSLSHRGNTGWHEFQVWFRFALWASGQVKGFSWVTCTRVHDALSAPLACFVPLGADRGVQMLRRTLPTSTSLNIPTSASTTTSEHNFWGNSHSDFLSWLPETVCLFTLNNQRMMYWELDPLGQWLAVPRGIFLPKSIHAS